MERGRAYYEDEYDIDDGVEAYQGMDAYTGGERIGPVLIRRVGVDDEVEDDEDDEDDGDYIPGEDDDEDDDMSDVQRDTNTEELLEAMVELEAGGNGHVIGQFFVQGGPNESGDGAHDAARLNAVDRILSLFRSAHSSLPIPIPRRTEGDEPHPNFSQSERIRRAKEWWKKPHKEPQPAGVELLMSGEFGRIGPKTYSRGSQNLARVLRERSINISRMPTEDLCENLVPNSPGAVVASYPANVDSPKSQIMLLQIRLSTMFAARSPTVYMTKTLEYDSTQIPINFSDPPRGTRHRLAWDMDDNYCIWSCRFSADGNEVIAGGRGKIFVYDLLANRRTVKISAHEDDVNSCCWADSGSNVLISASDDTFLKVWDRRSLGSSTRPSGVLIGHTEGITNVSAKGDGRYVISNGKDQALRLWDLRKMRSSTEYEAVKNNYYGLDGFDYRYQDDRMQKRPAHPQDCSVMTYRGHSVMRTLIRCHFSPAESTGGSYIYSGSCDGRIHIWSLDGRVVQVLDRSQTLPISFNPSAPDLAKSLENRAGGSCVRDVSWHSHEPVMLSAAWGAHGNSTVARHEWKGLSKMGGRLEDYVEKNAAEARHQQARKNLGRTLFQNSTRRQLGRIPGAFLSVDVDDDVEEHVVSDEDD
ncbi:hypothetical protein EW145_g4993 [Phellinidium pouzarii]|uniref:Uncharacterized protein n=1 Tax=Phellinidium pouzarii TaxID=167371 RepID=A0A4S4L256_9AGAM|nr:hypothetical protein EW145_g4993 [Phellinidium pouzarii]